MTPSIVWLLHSAAVWFMTGLIWLIQCVQYPLFMKVGRAEFPEFHRLHSAWITPVVAPIMLLELATAVMLLLPAWAPEAIPLRHRITCLVLTLSVFAFTAVFSVPAHNRLAIGGLDEGTLRFLVVSNWLRTAAWTIHGALALGLTARLLAGSDGR